MTNWKCSVIENGIQRCPSLLIRTWEWHSAFLKIYIFKVIMGHSKFIKKMGHSKFCLVYLFQFDLWNPIDAQWCLKKLLLRYQVKPYKFAQVKSHPVFSIFCIEMFHRTLLLLISKKMCRNLAKINMQKLKKYCKQWLQHLFKARKPFNHTISHRHIYLFVYCYP